MRFAMVRSLSTELVAAPAPGKTQVQLSSWDRSYLGFQVTAVVLFDGPVNQPVEAVKKGLSRALVHYGPIAGHLAADEEESLSITCTREGVPFVAATVDCAMADHGGLLNAAPLSEGLLDDLAVYYHPNPEARRTDTLLLMHVTEFACGGFTVGVTWNHTLADGDGDGMAQFIQDVGNLARADEAAVSSPLRDGGKVSLLSPPVVAAKQWLMLDRGGMGLAYLDITIPATLINRIKSDYKAAHAGDGGYCTTFEAGVAVLWRCRTRAILGDSYDPSTPAPLAFLVNVRKHVRAVAGYYGNCAVAQMAFAAAGEVAGGDIAGVIDLIKRAKDGVPDLLNVMHGGRGVDGVGEMMLRTRSSPRSTHKY